MVLAVHIIVGAAIATKTQNPILGLSFAFLSHYLIDIIPHQKYNVGNILNKQWKNSFKCFLKITADLFLGIGSILLFSKNTSLGLAGGFLAILPDGLTFLYLIFPGSKILKPLYNFHRDTVHFHRNKKIPLSWKIFSQIMAAAISVTFLLR